MQNDSDKSQTNQQAVWLIAQLALFGVGISCLQVIALITLHSFSSIFTSGSQLQFIIPIAICILLVLTVASHAEGRCIAFIRKLDVRLKQIQVVLADKSTKSKEQPLEKIMLPLVVGLPATPLVAWFLLISSPYLFGLLVLHLICNYAVIASFSSQEKKLKRRSQQTSDLDAGAKAMDLVIVPDFLLQDRVVDSFMGRQNAIPDSSDLVKLINKKREVLSVLRRLFQGCILGLSAILAVMQLASLGSILGFIIISNSFRRPIVALFEVITSPQGHIGFGQLIAMVRLSLLPADCIQDELQLRHQKARERVQSFSDQYSDLLSNKKWLRFDDFSLTVLGSDIMFDHLSGRIKLSAATVVQISNRSLSRELEDLLIRRTGSFKEISWKGFIGCGREKLDADFARTLPIVSPKLLRGSSNNIADHFSENFKDRVEQIVDKHGLWDLILQGEGMPHGSAVLSKGHIERLRSVVCAISLVLEPCPLVIAAFIIDAFEYEARIKILKMIQAETSEPLANRLILTRTHCGSEAGITVYGLTRNDLISLQ